MHHFDEQGMSLPVLVLYLKYCYLREAYALLDMDVFVAAPTMSTDDVIMLALGAVVVLGIAYVSIARALRFFGCVCPHRCRLCVLVLLHPCVPPCVSVS